MNWKLLLQILGPILSMLLAGWTGKDALGIQSGVYEATASNWSLVGLTGSASLAALLSSLWASISAGKSIDVRQVATYSALAVLHARADRTGDKRLVDMVAALSAHIYATTEAAATGTPRRPTGPLDDAEPPPIHETLRLIELRTRWEQSQAVLAGGQTR